MKYSSQKGQPASTSARTTSRLSLALTSSLVAFLLPAQLHGADGVWDSGTGSWNDSTNWVDDIIAGGADSTATFNTDGGTVTFDVNATLGHLNIEQSKNFNYSGGVKYLTLQTTTGTPTITVGSGTALFGVPVRGSQGYTKLGEGTISYSIGTAQLTGQIFIDEGAIAVRSNSAFGASGIGNETIIRGTGNTAANRGSIRFETTTGYTVAENIIFRLDNSSTATFNDLIVKQQAAASTLSGTLVIERNGISSGDTRYGIAVEGGTLNQTGSISGALSTGATEAGAGSTTYLAYEVSSGASAIVSGGISDGTIGAGGLALSKAGDGALVLEGTNTFTGGIVVEAGDFTLADTGTLGFDLAAGNQVTGSSVGMVAFDGTFNVTLEGEPLSEDSLWTLISGIFGDLSYGETFEVTIAGSAIGDTITLNTANNYTVVTEDGTWNYDITDPTDALSFVTVPEPSTCVLLSAVLLAVVAVRRRR